MFKSSFHFAINLLEYISLADGTPNLRLVVDKPVTLECALGVCS